MSLHFSSKNVERQRYRWIEMISWESLYWVYLWRSRWAMFSQICKQFSSRVPVENPPISSGFNCPPPTLLLDPLIAQIVPRISNDNPSQDHPGSREIISHIPPGPWRSFGSSGEHARAGRETWRRRPGGQELWRRGPRGQEPEQHRGQPLEAAGGGQRVQSRQHGELCKVIFLGRDFSIRNQCMAEVKMSYPLGGGWWDFLMIWLISSSTSTLTQSNNRPPQEWFDPHLRNFIIRNPYVSYDM